MALTFFKTPRNKKYNYRPVYYDKKKEESKERLESTIKDKDDGDYESALRAKMQNRWKRTAGAKEKKTSNTRLVVIILAITLLLYWIFFR